MKPSTVIHKEFRTVRNSSWSHDDDDCTSASHIGWRPRIRIGDLGFRIKKYESKPKGD
jgi:hypothetical protein